MANIDTVSNIRYEASVTKASLFGLARIATISFPLARCPMIARKYYWISVLGSEWQAVTLYHYAKRNTSARSNTVPQSFHVLNSVTMGVWLTFPSYQRFILFVSYL